MQWPSIFGGTCTFNATGIFGGIGTFNVTGIVSGIDIFNATDIFSGTCIFSNKKMLLMRHGGLSVMRLLTELVVAGSTPCNDPGQVVCAHVPLSPSSIIWYRRKLGSKRQVL